MEPNYLSSFKGMNNQFDDNDYWKGVILYGLNQATYKIALGKSLIELTSLNKEIIDWNELSNNIKLFNLIVS